MIHHLILPAPAAVGLHAAAARTAVPQRCDARGRRARRVEAVKTIVIEGNGVNYNLGQDMKPEAATQTFEITGYVRKIDIANGRQRVEQTRTPKFAYFQGPQPQTQIQALDGDVAFNVEPAGEASRVGAARRNAIAAPTASITRSPRCAPRPSRSTTVSNVRTVGTTCARPTSRSGDIASGR